MTELRRLRGSYSEYLLLSGQRGLEEEQPKNNLQGQPIDLSVSSVEDPSVFGTQEENVGNDNDNNKELFIYLAIIAMVCALLLCTCVVVTMIIRSALRKKVHVKSSPPVDATDNLPVDSASSVMDSAASRSTATGGKSALHIPLPASLVDSKKQRRSTIPKDLSVAVLQNNAAMLPRTPLHMPPESYPEKETKQQELDEEEEDASSPPRQYSPSMRLLLEQVETLSLKPGQVPLLPIHPEQLNKGTSVPCVDHENLTEL